MTLSIPYSFTAGTKAKAQEVNADFQAVQTEVNAIGADVITAQTDITSLQNGKASVNGSGSNTFAVADPINAADAVNKRYYSSINKYIIAGLLITAADEEYIACTAGACYDKTASKILQFDTDTSISEAPYNANATYYVYIIGTAAGGTNTQLLISQSSDNPGLPSGYTLYRGLGYFKTNSDGEIKEVSSYAMITGDDLSKYTKSVVIETYENGTSGYRIYSDGYCEQWGQTNSVGYDVNVKVYLAKPYKDNNYSAFCMYLNSNQNDRHTLYVTEYNTDYVCFEVRRIEEVNHGTRYLRWRTFGYLPS